MAKQTAVTAKVLRTFRDKYTQKLRGKGTEFSCDEKRVAEINFGQPKPLVVIVGAKPQADAPTEQETTATQAAAPTEPEAETTQAAAPTEPEATPTQAEAPTEPEAPPTQAETPTEPEAPPTQAAAPTEPETKGKGKGKGAGKTDK